MFNNEYTIYIFIVIFSDKNMKMFILQKLFFSFINLMIGEIET